MSDESADERMARLITDRMVRPLPKRFYKSVSLSDENVILLDNRPVKTPLRAQLKMPSRVLAEAVAEEWRAQEKLIDPAFMPLTKLANTAIDRATTERELVLTEITQYAGSDLVCYFAVRPLDLLERQKQQWQPVLDWATQKLEAKFVKAFGITHVTQPAEVLGNLRRHVEQLDQWNLTGVYLLTTLSGSSLVSLMLQAQNINPDAAWTALHVDEDYQIEQWGDDWEATQRRVSRKREFDGLVRFFALLRA